MVLLITLDTVVTWFVPFLVLGWLWGGRGILALLAFLTVWAADGLVYLFFIDSREFWTGMEGLALVTVPFTVAVTGLCGLLAYGLLRLIRKLPWQRHG